MLSPAGHGREDSQLRLGAYSSQILAQYSNPHKQVPSPSGDTNSQLFPTKFLHSIWADQSLSKNCSGLQNCVKSGFDMGYIIKVSAGPSYHI